MIKKCDFTEFDAIANNMNIKLSASAGGFVYEQAGTISALQALDKLSLAGSDGLYLHAPYFMSEGDKAGIAGKLLEAIISEATASNIVLLCADTMPIEINTVYTQVGFASAFTMHTTVHEIRANLWSTADFDSITASSLRTARQKFITFPFIDMDSDGYVSLLTYLYQNGASTASTERGYAIYFKSKDSVHIKEIFADSDADMLYIIQAIVNHDSRNIIKLDISTPSGLFAGEGSAYMGGLFRYTGDKTIDFANAYNSMIEV